MTANEFLAAEHIYGLKAVTDAEKRREIKRIRDATDTVNAYAYRHTDTTRAADDLAAELVDELGLNGRPMQTSRHYRKNNPAGMGKL